MSTDFSRLIQTCVRAPCVCVCVCVCVCACVRACVRVCVCFKLHSNAACIPHNTHEVSWFENRFFSTWSRYSSTDVFVFISLIYFCDGLPWEYTCNGFIWHVKHAWVRLWIKKRKSCSKSVCLCLSCVCVSLRGCQCACVSVCPWVGVCERRAVNVRASVWVDDRQMYAAVTKCKQECTENSSISLMSNTWAMSRTDRHGH